MPAEMTLDALAGWAGRAKQELQTLDLTIPLNLSAQELRRGALECFTGQHDPFGSPWLPLKKPRQNSKGNDQILRNTGILMASVIAAAGGAGHIQEITRNSLVWGSNIEYARIQNEGGTIQMPERTRGPGEKPWVFTTPDGKTVFTRRIKAHVVVIPARQFIGVSPESANRIQGFFADYVMGRLK